MTIAVVSPPFRAGIRSFDPVVARRGLYTGHTEDYVSRFRKLVRRWRAETAYLSSTTEMFEHPAFAEIVSMEDRAIPLIIDELERQPDLLVGALARITGENPVAQSDRGDIYAMAITWIEWYRRRER